MEEIPDMTVLEQANIWIMTGLTAAFFFAAGTALGSFLNVLAYRWPRRMPVGRAPSQCPECQVLIPWRDNVPLVGYLRLGGFCQCGLKPIAPRYPLVELAYGSVVLALLFVELLSGGANLPIRSPNVYAGVVWIIWFTKWDLMAIYGYHLALMFVLIGMTLVRLDGLRLPWQFPALGLAIGLLLPAVSPGVQQVVVPLGPAPAKLAATAIVGLAAGLALGALLDGARRPYRVEPATAIGMGLVGLYLGWQAALSTALIAAALMLAAAAISRLRGGWGRVEPLVAVTAAALVQILAWGRLSGLRAWPGHDSGPGVLIGSALAVAALVLAARLLRRVSSSAWSPVPTAPPEPDAPEESDPPMVAGDPAQP